ncbi:MAG TPA: pilus assembly protein [Verrucomicrobiales bacterium]|nr:pilus assembly protein [Verrucomicrobiales bacterium]
MKHAVLLDTGPLVALLDRRDQWHAWAKDAAKQVRLPWLTTEAILTEACFLLASHSDALKQIEAYASRGAFQLLPLTADALRTALSIMRKYADVPMSFADASLVLNSELQPQASIFTLDSDFSIYRRQDGTPLQLLAPFAA